MSKLKIKDIVVVALFKGATPIGEAPGRDDVYHKMTPMDRAQMVDRLFMGIGNLIEQAEIDHLKNSRKESVVDPNYITRISTNEFFFYTFEPLTLQEFEALQNKVAEKVAKLPSGIHLVLGSFAVKTADKQVMNVTPLIASGSQPSFNFIVKNYTSSVDVRYKEKNANGQFEILRAFDNLDGSGPGRVPKIDVAGKPRLFTFNNVISCETPEAGPFLTAVDICLDHAKGVAKINIERLINENPILASQPISHMLVSNTIKSISKNCFGTVVHVDPSYSIKGSKKGATQIMRKETETPHFFGEDTVRIFDLSLTACLTVQQAQQMQSLQVVQEAQQMQMQGEMQRLQEIQMLKEVQAVQEEEILKEMQMLQAKLKQVVESLEKLKFGPVDEVINKLIQDCRNKFDAAFTMEEKCEVVYRFKSYVMELELNLKWDSAVEQIREIIADFRKNAGPFSIGMHAKADRIEAAMSKVPLQDRCNFIQSESCKDVMRLLGEHRVRYKKGSSATLKSFKAKFFPEESRGASRKEVRENGSISPSPTPK